MSGADPESDRPGGAALPPPDRVATPWFSHFPRGVPREYPVPAVDATRLLDDAVQDFPDAVALVHRRRRWTYRQLLDLVDRFATTLDGCGVGAGGRVAVALPNGPQAVTALFAVWRLGAGVALCDPGTDRASLLRRARELDAAVLVGDERRFGGIVGGRADRDKGETPSGSRHTTPVQPRQARTPRILLTGDEDVLTFPGNLAAMARRSLRHRGHERMFDLLRRSRPIDAPATAAGPGRPAVVLDDDGGPQVLTHAQLVHAAFQLRLWLPDVVAGGERVVSSLPLHTGLGLTAAVTMPVLAAATMVVPANRGAREVARTVDRADPTIAVLPAARVDEVVTVLRGSGGSLRVLLGAGAVPPDVVATSEQRTRARVRAVWAPPGSAGIVVAEPVYGVTKAGSMGIPVTNTRVIVVEPATRRLCDPDHPGRVLVHGPQVPGAGTGTPTGWWDSGCPAAMDADGFLTLRAEAGTSVALED